MKLQSVHVDGFGIWSDITLAELSPHCTVFYGPNEAGKTTLLEFIRTVLYGFSPQRIARYLPPVHTAIGGGSITVSIEDEGQLHVCRPQNSRHPLGPVTVEAADGTVQGEAHLQRLLHNVDETMFQNVFAVGLQELQELGTLNDTEAARWLYVLTAGLDRVSLCDVLSELENSRRRLWSEPTSQIGELLSEHARLQSEVAELSTFSQQLERLIEERAAADQQSARLEGALAEQETTCRKWETVAAIHNPWQRRAQLNARIAALGPAAQWPPDALDRMHRLSAAAARARRKKRRLHSLRNALAEKARSIKPSQLVLRQAARIEALSENESWITSLEQEIRQADETVKRLTLDHQTLQDRLMRTAGVEAPPNSSQPSTLPLQIDRSAWRSLRRPAAQLLDARRFAQEQRQQINQQRTAQTTRRQELEQTLSARGQKDLTAALETAGQRVAQLRRRLQLDELIDQLAHNKSDLEQSISSYLERQILPPWMLLSLGGIFVLGVVLILGGLLLPGSFTGSLGWPMAWLGLLGVGSAVAAKYTMERSAANQLDASRRQLTLVESQTQQAQSERSDLDRSLPKAVGSLAARLQSAQQDLAKLEELLPLEAQRQSLAAAALDTDSRQAQAEHDYQISLENWQAALASQGLPHHLMPAQVKAVATSAEQLGALQRQLADAQSDLDRRRRELLAFTARLEQVFSAAEVSPQSTLSSQQLRQLQQELSQQEGLQKQRDALIRRRKKLRRRQRIISGRLRRLRNRRRHLFRICGVVDLAEFRRRAAEFSQIAAIIAQRDVATQEVAACLASYTSSALGDPESEISSLVTNASSEHIAAELSNTKQRLDEIRRQQRQLFEESGRRNEQIRLLAGDRRLTVKRFELAQIQQRAAAAISRWQVLTLTHRWLELIKEHYERHRQPETLKQASEYLAQLTAGRYRRVWTRWGENSLLVDDADGHTLPVEVLSRGTREQLFLSLRLALVGLFAKRGIELPMVLDDVLVNFDTDRATAAVQVLHDFSQRGHQLLVFTCHEHLARLFKNHRTDVRRLPADHQSGRDQPFVADVPLPPRRHRARRPKDETIQPPTLVTETLPKTQPPEPPVAASMPEPLRVDSSEQAMRLSPLMRRWAYWQDAEDEHPEAVHLLSESESPKLTAMAQLKMAGPTDDLFSPIIIEPSEDDPPKA